MQKPGGILLRIHSGGQTGVDRAALDIAIESGLEHGGWCPLGRKAEDGIIPERYHLRVTTDIDYSSRTRLNVKDTDGTLILYRGEPEGGTALTAHFAGELRRPLLMCDVEHPVTEGMFKDWLQQHHIETLNIAGPRESKQPGIYRQSIDLLRKLLA